MDEERTMIALDTNIGIRERMKLEFGPMLKQLGEMLKTEVAAGRYDLRFSHDYAVLIENAWEARVRAFYSAAFHEGYEEGRRYEERRWRERLEEPPHD